MTARNDANRTDFAVNWPLPATGSTLLGMTPQSGQTIGTAVNPYSFQDLLGFDNVSLTLSTLTGSTAVGAVTIEVTDFAGTEYDVFGTNIPWAAANYPNTTTPISQAIATGQNNYNICISNTGWKWLRVRYTATSGTGTINAAITCRANSRT